MTDSEENSERIYIDIEAEIAALRNLFPTISRSEFYFVETGTIGAKLRYEPTFGDIDGIDVLLEYPRAYPDRPPRMWVTSPDIDSESGLVAEFDDRNDARADYVDPDQWNGSLNGFHAAVMMKEWVVEYCQWRRESESAEQPLEDIVADIAASVDSYRTDAENE